MSGERPGLAVLIAYYAPPAVGIAAQRLAGFVRHLPESGWEPVVVAPESVHFHRSEGSALPDGVRVVRVPNPEPSRWLRGLAGRGLGEEAGPQGIREVMPLAPGSLGRWARSLVRDWLYVPDAQWPWIPGAARAAGALLGEARGRRAVVFSTSVPFSAHFAARRAAGEAGAPWVAEYRDPWSVAPPQFGRRPRLRQFIDRRLDRGVVRGAQGLVYTSEATAARYRAHFGADIRGPVAVVRNGFDAILEDQAPPPADPLRLLYSGTLLSASYAEPLVSALDVLDGEEPGRVVLDVFGPPVGWLAAGAVRVPSVRLRGVVPPGEMPAHLVRSSALVLLQPDPRHAEHVAGKLYEYLGARRPVVAAIPAGCEAWDLLRNHGDLRHVPTLDVPTLVAVLRGLLSEHREGRLAGPRVSEVAVDGLSRRAQTAVLARVFDRVSRTL